jgi:hypothetical protein
VTSEVIFTDWPSISQSIRDRRTRPAGSTQTSNGNLALRTSSPTSGAPAEPFVTRSTIFSPLMTSL